MTRDAFLAWLASPPRRTLVMGVLNVTPDSFSDGGEFDTVDSAVRHGLRMAADGADLIDIGGESTRPGAARVPADVQIDRILPVIRPLAEAGVTISVDTTLAKVADAAIAAGATMVNDVSAGRDDPGMAPLVARLQVPIALMHMQGQPATMQANPVYGDVVAEVLAELQSQAAAFERAGVPAEQILIDPGIGFGKTLDHNLDLLRNLPALVDTGRPLLVGTSRKGFIGKLLSRPDPADRLFGTAASVAWAVACGVAMVRVHDVRAMKDVVTVAAAIADRRSIIRSG